MNDQLYPKIVKEEELTDLINKSKNKDRLNMMNREIEILKTQKDKYMKIKKNYTKYDNLLRNTFTCLSTVAAITTITISTITPFGIIPVVTGSVLTAVFGGIPIIKSVVSKAITSNFTTKRKSFFEERIFLVNEYLNKLYYYVEKVKDDGIITIDELDKFNKLLSEYTIKINDIKMKKNLSKQIEPQIQSNDDKNIDNKTFTLLDENDKAVVEEKVKYTLKTQQLEAYEKKLLETKNIIK